MRLRLGGAKGSGLGLPSLAAISLTLVQGLAASSDPGALSLVRADSLFLIGRLNAFLKCCKKFDLAVLDWVLAEVVEIDIVLVKISGTRVVIKTKTPNSELSS